MAGLSVFYVAMSVRVLSMFYGSVLLTRIYSREEFMIKLRSTLGEAFKDFEALDNIERASFVLGCELSTENFDSMLALVKEYIIDLWEVRKVKLYGEPCSTQPQSQSLAGDLRDGTVVGGQRRGRFGKFSHSGRVTGKLSTCITVIDNSCKTGSAYTGHVVNGRIARAAS